MCVAAMLQVGRSLDEELFFFLMSSIKSVQLRASSELTVQHIKQHW